MTILDTINSSIDLLDTMLTTIPDTPFIFLFGLAIVLIVIRHIFDWLGV